MFDWLRKIRSDIAGLVIVVTELRKDIALLREEASSTQKSIGALVAQLAAQGADVERGKRFYQGLNAVGVLNYENDVVSGERRFLSRFLQHYPEAVIFDVGANIGGYARLARELSPSAVIHSFEPNPPAFERLKETATKLGTSAYALALGEAKSEIEIFDYADEAGSQHASAYRGVIEGIHRRPAVGVKVPCETVDSIAEQLRVERIGLLKIDVEGAELAVLKGARQLLDERRIDVIQFEFNEMAVVSRVYFKDFFDILHGYRLHRLLQDGAIAFDTYDPRFMEVFAYQNIVGVRKDLDPHWVE